MTWALLRLGLLESQIGNGSKQRWAIEVQLKAPKNDVRQKRNHKKYDGLTYAIIW